MGKDHTLFAMVPGKVKFALHGPKQKNTVSIEPAQA
jgi:ribosomal protein L27